MKVIYLVNSDFAMAGTGNTSYNAVRGIHRHGYLQRVIVRAYRKNEIDDALITTPMPFLRTVSRLINGFFMYVLRDLSTGFYYTNILFDKASLRYVERCDIFHSWNAPLSCLRKAKKNGSLIVTDGASSHPLTQYALMKEEYERYGVSFEMSKRFRDSLIEALSFCDYILVPSKFVYDSYVANGVPKKKLVFIPFGVDLKRYVPRREKKDKIFRAIFVGQIELRKGVQYLLEAWHRLGLKNAELILRGRIHTDAQKIVDSYRSKINLKTPGYGDPRDDYARSDIFVFPSIEEGSALVSYEAMAAGLPVVVTYNTGSVARNGKDGFIIPIRDVDALAKKIRYFYDNPKEIKKMGKSARRQVEHYSWDLYGERVVKAYKEMLHERQK